MALSPRKPVVGLALGSGSARGWAHFGVLRALEDAGLSRDEVDGLIVAPPTAYERMGEILNIDPRWGGQADAVQAVFQAVMAIKSGMAEVVALVYGNDQRSAAVQYGGPEAMGGGSFLSYVYHLSLIHI